MMSRSINRLINVSKRSYAVKPPVANAEVAELDKSIVNFSTLSVNDRQAIIRILSKAHAPVLRELQKMITGVQNRKKDASQNVDQHLESLRKSYYADTDFLKNLYNKEQRSSKLLADLVVSTHQVISKLLQATSLEEYLARETNDVAQQFKKKVEVGVGLTLEQVAELYKKAIQGEINREDEGTNQIVNFSVVAQSEYEREFNQELSSSGGDTLSAQKIVLARHLWSTLKKNQGESYVSEEEHSD
ncbi:peroxisomal acyl-coenzyme A oxidase [Acrasis kona]|uniref:Peroxisomal acyl-coenzyme A oxidase n=1 Tax=Acrasis kona TaxID=1008807 RepID=A0AAW2YNY2_9EUKA